VKEIVIRKAMPDDIPMIRQLFDSHYRKDYFLPGSHIRRAVTGEVEARFGKQRNPHNVYLAFDDSLLVGMALVNRSGCLNNLLVHKQYRGCGVGSSLISFASPTKVRCKVDNSDGDPTPFYEKQGFVTIGQYDLWGNLPLDGKKRNIKIMVKPQC